MNRIEDLNEVEIKKHLSSFAESVISAISVYDSVVSTQDLARQGHAGRSGSLHKSGAYENGLYIANYQTQGRGRNAKQWLSIPGAQILLSLTWQFQSLPKQLSALSLVLAVELVKVIKSETGIEASIKWPNDIYVGGRKLAGLLVDAETIGGNSRVIIGLGLNLLIPVKQRSEFNVADLSDSKGLDRNKLIAKIVSSWSQALEQFSTLGFPAWQLAFNKMAIYRGDKVRLTRSEPEEGLLLGIYDGVDADGCLLISTENGEQRKIWDSRWSLRPYDD